MAILFCAITSPLSPGSNPPRCSSSAPGSLWEGHSQLGQCPALQTATAWCMNNPTSLTQCFYSVCELPLFHDCRCWKSWTSSSRSVKYYLKRLDCHLLLLVFLSRSYSHPISVLQLQWMARSLVANEQGGPLAQLTISPRQPLQHRTLGAIVVHTAAVLFCRQRVEILQPFVNMLNNPAALVVSVSLSGCELWKEGKCDTTLLQNAYLPTMPEDMLPEARRLLGGTFYGNYHVQWCTCLSNQ